MACLAFFQGKLDPLIGREKQVERIIQILCKRRKNNPCLLGDPGVGKTVVVEGFASKIVNTNVPLKLQGKKVRMFINYKILKLF